MTRMTMDEWREYSTLKNLEFRAIEYSYIENLISVDKFLDYCNSNNVDMAYLLKKYGAKKSRKIIKNLLKSVIKKRQRCEIW